MSGLKDKEIIGKLPTLMYIKEDDAVIYHKEFGIIIYNMKEEEITKRLSYEKMMKDINGDDKTTLIGILTSANASSLMEEGGRKFYTYSMEKNKLIETTDFKEIDISYARENKYSYLILKDNRNTFGDLELVTTDMDTGMGNKKTYKIFQNSTNKGKSGSIDVSDILSEKFEYLPYIIYGDKEKVYLYDEVMGMIVYDLKEKSVVSRLKYEEISKKMQK